MRRFGRLRAGRFDWLKASAANEVGLARGKSREKSF
jgi:hypothetical protein